MDDAERRCRLVLDKSFFWVSHSGCWSLNTMTKANLSGSLSEALRVPGLDERLNWLAISETVYPSSGLRAFSGGMVVEVDCCWDRR